MTKRVAIYAGSFDPVTIGHIEVLNCAKSIADKIYVAIGTHPSKTPLFDFDERARLILESLHAEQNRDETFEVLKFDGLLVDAARKCGARVLIRGLRDSTDLDYEMQMAGMNEVMAPHLQTVFIPSSPPVRTITATLVRQIAALGGDVSPFVPPPVAIAISRKFTQGKG